ncbi:MAG: twin-arginine translocase subunit TatB [Lysobacteraceae bacterium]|nr:MAG: twin-arginine translocase subunit TatB [Xanthomonadaceae bacterium]
MFDVGFSELFLIAIVALVVLGPERLPKAARFAGLWVRRARAQWYSVKSELERELAAEELQRNIRETREAVHAFDTDIRDAEFEARREFEALRDAGGPKRLPSPDVDADGGFDENDTPAATDDLVDGRADDRKPEPGDVRS